MIKINIFSAFAGIAVVAGAAALVKKTFFNGKKHKESSAFIETADEVNVSIIDEQSGEVVDTTSDDVILPIEKLPEEFKKKDAPSPKPISPETLEKIQTMMKQGYTVMVVAKKYGLSRHKAYAIFYALKREETNHKAA